MSTKPIRAAGLIAGAGLMYFLDPRSGRRRRAVLSGKLRHLGIEVDGGLRRAGRDLWHRGRGGWAELTGRFRDVAADDAVIEARVHTELGHVCSHPGAIHVVAAQGRVGLRGKILKKEVGRVLRAVSRVRGVTDITHDLEIHEDATGISSLQGGSPRPGTRFELRQRYWSPGVRLIMGGLGGLAATLGFARGGLGTLAGAGGLVLLSRSLTNMETRRLLGVGAGRRAVDIKKSLHIGAPIDEVYGYFRKLENFPRFMRHVEEVRHVGDGLYHWRISGPAKLGLSWDAEVTREEAPHVLAWRSLPGAIVGQAGTVRFIPDHDDTTRIDIQLSYNPPAGALGHAFAKALGMDPKKQMDNELLRFKSLLENGKATGKHGTVERDEL